MTGPELLAAGLGRRLAALFYDALLTAAVLFLGTLVLLPLTGGEAITPQDSGPWEVAYRAWLLLLALGYFCGSWLGRGQTLGMMSWKIRLQRDAGGLPRTRDALLRFALGAAGAIAALAGVWVLHDAASAAAIALGVALLLPAIGNYLAMYAGPGARTLLDRCTRCRVVRSP
jgi:uncharacterized RDD family membrane protein YckC